MIQFFNDVNWKEEERICSCVCDNTANLWDDSDAELINDVYFDEDLSEEVKTLAFSKVQNYADKHCMHCKGKGLLKKRHWYAPPDMQIMWSNYVVHKIFQLMDLPDSKWTNGEMSVHDMLVSLRRAIIKLNSLSDENLKKLEIVSDSEISYRSRELESGVIELRDPYLSHAGLTKEHLNERLHTLKSFVEKSIEQDANAISWS